MDASSSTPTVAPQSGRGVVQDIVLNIFEPGVNRSVLIFLNLTFLLLILTLIGITVLVGLDLHILFLMVLAVGLMVGFNWYVYIYSAVNYLLTTRYDYCRFIGQLPSSEDKDSQSAQGTNRTKQD